MSAVKNVLVDALRTLSTTTKHLWKSIDWDVVQILVLVGMVPAMLIIGALFPSLLANYR